MKKVLLASVALVALGAASAQASEPLKLTVGGFLQEMVGYVDNHQFNQSTAPGSVHLSQVDVNSLGLIQFKASTTLDNGISAAVNIDTFASSGTSSKSAASSSCGRTPWGQFTKSSAGGAAFELGAPNCGNNTNIYRSYGTLSGGFGSLIIGQREDATYIIHNTAPDVSTYGPVGDSFVGNVGNIPTYHHVYQQDNTTRYDGTTSKLTYISPSFMGAAIAATYNPSMSYIGNSSSPADATSGDNPVYFPQGRSNGMDYNGDLYAAGLAYNNKFGNIGVKADFSVAQANVANLRMYNGGTQISFAGFTVGGSFFNREVPTGATIGGIYNQNQISGATGILNNSNGAGGVQVAALAGTVTPNAYARYGAFAGNNWTGGVSYATGPYAVSFALFHDNTKEIAVMNGTGKADSTLTYEFGAAYTMGPGVKLNAGIGYFDYKGDVGVAATPWTSKNDGVFVATGLRLDF